MQSHKSLLSSIIKGRFLSWLKILLTILVFATVAFATYVYAAVRVKGYPHEMRLIDQQYRIIQINLEGITATHIHASRRDTGRFFIY